MREIVVRELSNSPGLEWRASLRETTEKGITGRGRYGKTAEEALGRLQVAFDCTGLTVRYVPSRLVPIAEVCAK